MVDYSKFRFDGDDDAGDECDFVVSDGDLDSGDNGLVFSDFEEYFGNDDEDFEGEVLESGDFSFGDDGQSADNVSDDFDDYFSDDFDYEDVLDVGRDVGESAVDSGRSGESVSESDGGVEVVDGVDDFTPMTSVEAEKWRVRREKKRIDRWGGDVDYSKNAFGLDSEVGRRGPREYVVDDGGNVTGSVKVSGGRDFGDVVGSGSSVEFVEDGRDNVVDGVFYPWESRVERRRGVEGDKRSREKINHDELDFFRNLGVGKNEFYESGLVDGFRKPVLAKESKMDRVSRVEKTKKGLGGKKYFASNNRSLSVSVRDQELLLFLGKFKYATANQLAHLRGCQENTMNEKLLSLRRMGLVEKYSIWGDSRVWVLTDVGMILSGLDLSVVNGRKISYALIAHQFVVNHVAANLWGGNVNVLSLSDFPVRNRVDSAGNKRYGETLVSEYEIQSSFHKFKGFSGSSVYRPKILDSIVVSFKQWNDSGGFSRGVLSPEMVYGNEYMWILWPPEVVNTNYHVPDLVVRRGRSNGGEPESIAVEIELNSKTTSDYETILRAYLLDKRIYKKVVWVCKGIGSAKALEAAAKEVGLWQEGRIDIVPIITADGVFKGRDLWKI